MNVTEIVVVNGKDEAGDKVEFAAPCVQFESLADAIKAIGESAALNILNGGTDIKCRAKHREQYSKLGHGADEEMLVTFLSQVGTSGSRSTYGVPASEAAKVQKLAGKYVEQNQFDKAKGLIEDFKSDPEGCLENLYATGLLRVGKKRANKDGEDA